ncbi:hypothetical protein [Bradyrhizobium sp. CCBAU 45384]|uniref:hypothetical protein n=1 Tax=Bradyrhizobium sp. CCBAU 45384 TaxID=858428 RepID=UPI0023053205|nr:hypothetical protein [Bradyrhizobium sp. CCBAU 45384]
MPVLADERLATLVRQVVPPRTQQWVVQIVDNHEEVCVMFSRNVLRVHRNWWTDVHDAGLHSVLAYHPLSLKKVPSQILRGLSSRTVVDVWQACALKKGYKGRLSEKRGFLARTAEGELAFAATRRRRNWMRSAKPDAQSPKEPVRLGLELNATRIIKAC